MIKQTKGTVFSSGSFQLGLCSICPSRGGKDGLDGCLWPTSGGKADSVAQQVDLPPDRTILGEGLQSANVWIVRSGFMRLQRYGFDGRRQILSLILPGEVVGYEQKTHEGLSIETSTACEVCRIDRRTFETSIAGNSDMRRALYQQHMGQLDRLRWLTWAIGALKPEERLCAFLALSTRAMPYQPMPDGSAILTMQLPRADIADLLGTTVETISRIIHKLDDMGVLLIKDPEHLQIVDLGRIIALGCIERTFHCLPFGRRFPDSAKQPCASGGATARSGTTAPMTAVNDATRPVALSSI